MGRRGELLAGLATTLTEAIAAGLVAATVVSTAGSAAVLRPRGLRRERFPRAGILSGVTFASAISNL